MTYDVDGGGHRQGDHRPRDRHPAGLPDRHVDQQRHHRRPGEHAAGVCSGDHHRHRFPRLDADPQPADVGHARGGDDATCGTATPARRGRPARRSSSAPPTWARPSPSGPPAPRAVTSTARPATRSTPRSTRPRRPVHRCRSPGPVSSAHASRSLHLRGTPPASPPPTSGTGTPAPISGQTGTTYTVGTADVGKSITVRATATKTGYTNGTSTSNAVTATQAAAVTPTDAAVHHRRRRGRARPSPRAPATGRAAARPTPTSGSSTGGSRQGDQEHLRRAHPGRRPARLRAGDRLTTASSNPASPTAPHSPSPSWRRPRPRAW